MELVLNNKDIIMKWYKKQASKDKLEIFEMPCNLPNKYDLDGVTKTKGVNNKIVEEIKKMGIGICEPIKVKVTPLLINNQCHYNCGKLCQIVNKKEKKMRHLLGYNFHACPCGKFYTLELHSVVQDIKTNEIMDFTIDYAGENEKWFIPIREVDLENYIDYICLAKDMDLEFFYNLDEEHSCLTNKRRIYWKAPKNINTYKGDKQKADFIKNVNNLKQIMILH